MKTTSSNSKKQRDPDFIGAEAAMKRAADKAREIARKTGTAVVYMKYAGRILILIKKAYVARRGNNFSGCKCIYWN